MEQALSGMLPICCDGAIDPKAKLIQAELREKLCAFEAFHRLIEPVSRPLK